MGSPTSRRAPVPLGSSCTILFEIAAFVLLSSLVEAVDIQFCTGTACGGHCIGCLDLPVYDCCYSFGDRARSVDVTNADIDVPANLTFYDNNVGCDEPPPPAGHGIGSQCFHQVSTQRNFTGAFWRQGHAFVPNGRLQSADIPERKPSTGHMYSNAAFFTEPGMEGRWVLPVANFTQYFSQVNDLSDAETLDWFKSQGAFYKP